jgi:26 proteasome complex subunit DSS1
MATTTPVVAAPPKDKPEILEEDDEFEEFETGKGISLVSHGWLECDLMQIRTDWNEGEEDTEDKQQWEDDWDDEDVDDDFSKQLR